MAQRFKNQSFFPARPTDQPSFAFLPAPWFPGSFNASSVGQTGTLFSSNDPTANVTFTFPVEATAVYYYGIKRSRGGLYAICVDCDNVRPNFFPVDGLNTTDDGTNPPSVLFSFTFKTAGIHRILLANQNDTRVVPSGNSQITLERFDLTVVDTSAPPATSPNTSGSPSGSPSPSSTVTPSSGASIGAIVGGVVGGIVFLLLLALSVLLCVRRKRKTVEDFLSPPETAQTSSAQTPYAQSLQPLQPMRYENSSYAATTASFPSSATGSIYQPPLRTHSRQVSDPSTSYSGTSNARSVPRRERDAGRIYEEEYEDEPTLPPEYGQVFSAGSRTSGVPTQAPSSPGLTESGMTTTTATTATTANSRNPAVGASRRPSRSSNYAPRLPPEKYRPPVSPS